MAVPTYTEEQAHAFRLGWPHLRTLSDEPEPDPAATAREALLSADPVLFVCWPRDVAGIYLRGMLHPRGSAEQVEVAARREALAPEDAPRLVARIVKGLSSTEDHHAVHALLLLEAFFGTRTAASWVADELEHVSDDEWRNTDNPWDTLFHVLETTYYYLLRLGAEGAFRARLAALRDRLPQEAKARLILGIGLEGAAGFRAAERAWKGEAFGYLKYLPFVEDDAELVRQTLPRWSPWQTPRLFWLAGEDTIAQYPLEVRGRDPWEKRQIVERYGVIRHPAIVRAFLALATNSDARPALRAWLEEHDAFVRPVLESIAAEEGDDAPRAKRLLELSLPKGGGSRRPRSSVKRK